MFDSEEIAQKALLCAGLIKVRRKRRWERLNIAALLLGISALTACFIFFSESYGGTGPPAQGSVTILDGAVVGGYALAAVTGFSLGAAVTLLCLRWRGRGKRGAGRGRID